MPEKTLYFPDDKILVIADLHIGKLGYFRKKGVPLPLSGSKTTLQNLEQLLTSIMPDKVLFLGDLFHTGEEILWQEFLQIIENKYFTTRCTLIRGNHDKFADSTYQRAGIEVLEAWKWANLFFTHEPLDTVEEGWLNIAGHIHPKVNIKGNGKQFLQLPCFLFTGRTFLLPAFGHFTGGKTMIPRKGDVVYAIANAGVFHFEAK